MLELFILMIERLGLIVLMAYILVQSKLFKNILTNRSDKSTQFILIAIFSLFAIISNVNGVEVQGGQVVYRPLFAPLSAGSSLANTRALTIGIAGIIGGPFVGISVGIISSIYRYFQGGLDPLVYVYSSLFIGIASGIIGQIYIKRKRLPDPMSGAVIAGGFELIQMAMILIASSQISQSIPLVQFIILPMTVVNSLGMAIFLTFIQSIQNQQLMDRAVQTHDVLSLANATLPHFRRGLDIESCTLAAKEIMNYISVAAVSITDKEKILAHVGLSDDHHKPGVPILTNLSKKALEEKRLITATSAFEIGCGHPDCELRAAIVVPLITKDSVVGTLKLYFKNSEDLTFVEKNVAEGLGNIFSSQIDLGKSELEAKLLQDAEIKSLQAQVNPHFFFNAINTISALIRIDTEKARDLLIKLSEFFRANLVGARSNVITIEQELGHVRAYQSLEQARFPDRYEVIFSVEDAVLSHHIPPFTLQVIVENAFKHAFSGRKQDNKIWVTISEKDSSIFLSVEDNGIGINEDIIEDVGKRNVKSTSSQGTGSALANLNKRLFHLFGEESQLEITSTNKGTRVSCVLPKYPTKV